MVLTFFSSECELFTEAVTSDLIKVQSYYVASVENSSPNILTSINFG